MLTLWWPW